MIVREIPSSFVSRVLVTIGLVVLAGLTVYFLGKLIEALLVIFAAVLLAVAITGVRCIIQNRTPLSDAWSLVATYFLIAVLITGAAAVIWPQLSEQIPKFTDQLPRAFEQLREKIEGTAWVEKVVDSAPLNGGKMAQMASICRTGCWVFSPVRRAPSSAFP